MIATRRFLEKLQLDAAEFRRKLELGQVVVDTQLRPFPKDVMLKMQLDAAEFRRKLELGQVIVDDPDDV